MYALTSTLPTNQETKSILQNMSSIGDFRNVLKFHDYG